MSLSERKITGKKAESVPQESIVVFCRVLAEFYSHLLHPQPPTTGALMQFAVQNGGGIIACSQ